MKSTMRQINKFIISILLIFATLFYADLAFKQKDEEILETFETQKISQKQYVYPLGNIVGIKAETEGALVIGFEENDKEYIGGLKIGDNIISIEGEKINNSKDITRIINKLKKDKVNVSFERENKIKNAKIKTKKDENNQYRLGLWIRDKISGIGTLTCYNPITNEFYAIGHGICDVDTEKLLNIKQGNIYNTSNIEIYKNNNRKIGQIKAIIDYEISVGNFFINSNNGTLDKLQRFPLIGALHSDTVLAKMQYRKIRCGDYVCVYRLIEKTVFVYRIVHGATDYPKYFR